MVKGAIHPNGSNFRRVARLDVVARVRKLSQMGLLKERPRWLEWCERVPPMENHNLHLQARTVRNPYPQMVNFLLNKYPDLRFQDCYVDGNDWSVGNDAFRDDHPVMQFVARQLEIMRTEDVSKKEAFEKTEKLFRERRDQLEREQKLMMAMAVDAGFRPMFSTGQAYLQAEKARAEAAHLQVIKSKLAGMRKAAQQRAAYFEGDEIRLDFGKFSGRTLQDVRQNEPSYCEWVLQETRTGPLAKFEEYLKRVEEEKKVARQSASPRAQTQVRQQLVGKVVETQPVKEKLVETQPDVELETADKELLQTETEPLDSDSFAEPQKDRSPQVDDIEDLASSADVRAPTQPLPEPAVARAPSEYEDDSWTRARRPSSGAGAEKVERMLGKKKQLGGGLMGEDEEDQTARTDSVRRRRVEDDNDDSDDDMTMDKSSRSGSGRKR